ncbi:EamA domain-containing membrane protein RarD [Cohaesibacter sp. ES.047]|uniref:DMT family transporter n=1 Tax=Cohaesibacter sp. ES.047 TaxID=1798205 RepID=UPI000BB6F2BB|nr:DMT family transporter [Cohaesibacter sp. ES.047]SNY94313.1 EamA domain-containing membrane protein RarD [Cohaesibacter sp. ES.047]
MNSLVGVGFKILATVLFAIMLAMIKYASQTVPTGQVVFARCFFALIPLAVFSMVQGNWRDCVRTQQPWLHLRRSIVGAMAMFLWFAAVSMLPLPEATAISFLSPLMMVALAAILLKETVRAYRWSAVAVGFVGVMIILSPRLAQSSGEVQTLGAILAVVSTVFMALAAILIRHMTKTEKNAAIIFYFFTATSIFSLVTLYWGWVIPEWDVMVALVLSGIFGGLGQIAVTQAYRMTEASLLAPFDYVNMVWVVLIAMVLFDEYPSREVIIGGFVVIVAGLFVVYREHKLGLARRAERRIERI